MRGFTTRKAYRVYWTKTFALAESTGDELGFFIGSHATTISRTQAKHLAKLFGQFAKFGTLPAPTKQQPPLSVVKNRLERLGLE